jgi:hypothetical protein
MIYNETGMSSGVTGHEPTSLARKRTLCAAGPVTIGLVKYAIREVRPAEVSEPSAIKTGAREITSGQIFVGHIDPAPAASRARFFPHVTSIPVVVLLKSSEICPELLSRIGVITLPDPLRAIPDGFG